MKFWEKDKMKLQNLNNTGESSFIIKGKTKFSVV